MSEELTPEATDMMLYLFAAEAVKDSRRSDFDIIFDAAMLIGGAVGFVLIF